MSHCISLKEAQRQLSRAACSFASLTRICLELWLQAAGDFPSMQQHIQTAPVMDLVGKALQQWPGRQGEVKKVAWLQKHMPGISTAMHECVSTLVSVSFRRVGILQSLVRSEQQPAGSQVLSQLKTEGQVCLYLEVLAPIFFIVLPVAVLGEGLLQSNRSHQQSSAHMQHRLRQGNDLISRVGSSLAQKAHIPAELHNKVLQIRQVLQELSMPCLDPEEAILDYTCTAVHATTTSGMLWLRLTALLPSHHPDMPHFLGHIDWCTLNASSLGPAELAVTRYVLSHAVAWPELLSEIQERLHPKSVWKLLMDFGVTPEYLQALGPAMMPAGHMQQVLCVLGASAPHVSPGVEVSRTLSDSSSDSRGGAVNDSSKSVASDDTSSSVAVDDGLMDMTELLHMMYGMDI